MALEFFGSRTAAIAGFLIFAAVPAVANPYYVYAANLALVYILLAIGLNLILGFAGQMAFAAGALFGIGAYSAGLLRLDAGLPFWLALPIGTLITTLSGVLIALPALRLRGLYLALATVAFAQFAVWAFVHWDSLTHGASGFVMEHVDFGMLTANSSIGIYYLSLIVTAVFVALAWNLLRSRVGRAFVAIRESEHAAEALGIGLTKYKILAYGLSALYAGVAGGLFGGLVGAIVPDQFNLLGMVLQLCMVFVGGIGSLMGSIIGAVLLVWMREFMRGLREFQEIGLGVLLLLTLLFFPGGLIQLLRRSFAGWAEPLRRTSGDDREKSSARPTPG